MFFTKRGCGIFACAFISACRLYEQGKSLCSAGQAQKSPSDAENFPADFRQLRVEPFGARNQAV